MSRIITPNHYPVRLRGLAGWWSYRNSGSVAASGIWKDYGGKGNNSQLYGSSYVDSKGLNLDGTTDYSNCGNDSSLGLSGARTMIAVINGTYGESDLHSIISKYSTTSATQEYYMVVYQQRLRALIGDGTGNFKISNSSVLSNNTTYHVAFTWSGISTDPLALYVNGEEDSADVVLNDTFSTALSGSQNLFLGARSTPSHYFNGFIDDVMIFNRALSAGEIKANYLKNMRG